ncbi:MAG: adenylate kinase [Bacteroidales bacterium]
MFNLILFGPPGSGKGTQSAKVAEKYRLAHISTGNIFRKEIKDETELGKKVKSIIDKGNLVPDELLIEIIERAIENHHDREGYIFDGFPRTCRQAEDMDMMLARHNDCVSMVLALKVNEEEVIKRLTKRAEVEGRDDDNEGVIRNRLEVYRKQTEPLIDHYKKQGKYHSVNGVGSIDEIFDNICRIIDPYIS